MPLRHSLLCLCAAALTLLAACPARGGEGLVSSTDMVFDAVSSQGGIRIVAADVPTTRYTEDYASSQVLEIIRPDDGPISVGRLIASCSCLSASMERREFAQGERALIEVRVVKKPPVEDAAYAIIVQLTEPERAAPQYDFRVAAR